MASAAENTDAEFGNWVKCCIALRYLRDGLKPFVDSAIQLQHQNIVEAIHRQFETALVHCEQCHIQPGKCVSHGTKLYCETCCRDHCANRLSYHSKPCIFTECLQCNDNYCEDCELSSHFMSLCDCTANSILPNHDKNYCTYQKCNCKEPRLRKTKPCKTNWCGHFYNEILNVHMFRDPYFVNAKPHLWKKNPWEFAKCFLSTPGHEASQSSDDADVTALMSICRNDKFIQTSIKHLSRLDQVCSVFQVQV